jgi:hypothetical protein
MADRITRKNVEGIFDVFLKSIGGRRAVDYKDVGAFRLDHNGIYGGYMIEHIVNEGGGISQPFGHTRRSAAEMWYTLSFAIDAMRYLEVTEQKQEVVSCR